MYLHYLLEIQVMKTNVLVLSLIAAGALLSGGCSSTGLTASSHLTNVQLTDGNYRVVATNISGEGSAEAVLGFCVGFGASQVALIPLTTTRMLYGNAMQDLWASF